MSTLTLAPVDWQQYAITAIDQFSAHRGAEIPSNQSMLRLVSMFDSVFFDFSDWAYDDLNENTSSYWGIPSGSLDISWYNFQNKNATDQLHTASMMAENMDAESGQDIVFIHDWAIEQARKAGSYAPGQRCFRFEFGSYAGSLPLAGLKFISRAV